MSKIYTIDKKYIEEKPEIRIGDKIYGVDNRLKTFEKINREITQKENKGDEFEIIIKNALGEKAYIEIYGMDLSFAVMQKVVILIMAAMQDIEEEEAEKRFRTR